MTSATLGKKLSNIKINLSNRNTS